MGQGRGVGRAVAGGVGAALVITVVAVVYVLASGVLDGDRATLPDEVVIALACEGEDGAIVTPLVAVVTVADGSVRSYDPLTEVTIPGTTYNELRDAYAFGGGPAVAAAIARLGDGTHPAYVILDADAWTTWVDAAGGLEFESPRPVDVFTGERLLSFPAGRQVLEGVETCEYLKGAAYLTDSQRERVAERFTEALARAVAELEPQTAGVTTDLSPEG